MAKKKQKRPRLGVAAIVIKDGAVLLGARRKGPGKGQFVLPGGGVELGEYASQALRREVYEETGLHVSVSDDVIDVIEVMDEHSHRVYLVMLAELDKYSTAITDTDELENVGFYDQAALTKLFETGYLQWWIADSLKRLKILPEVTSGKISTEK